MIRIVEPDQQKPIHLDHYAVDAHFADVVHELRAEAALLRPRLEGRRVWMINSTDKGGGVAEMLPRMLALMTDLGIDVRWAVIGSDEQAFFRLTKRLHNLVHGEVSAGVDLGPDDARLFEAVNRQNFDAFRPMLGPKDVVVVHDPQPLPLGDMLAAEAKVPTIWRCHIGLDERNEATSAAWRFMRPYLARYEHAAFSAPEYIPSFLAGRASILHPAIDPLSHKNRELSVHKMIGILCNGGLQVPYSTVPTADFEHQVRRLDSDGSLGQPGELGLLFRPIILQVSRWDRLKGWMPLLEAFVRLKAALRDGRTASLSERNRSRLAHARLILAGPDPRSIQDDPEGVAVFREITEAYRVLDPALQEDVAVLSLPMESRKDNGLIVNALQRCASIVVQNSLREGFGLTVTEAMHKQLAVVGTQACGIRQQIRHGVDGELVRDAEDPDEIAQVLIDLVADPARRFEYGRVARRRVHDQFLVFRQIASWVQIVSKVLGTPRKRKKRHDPA